MTEDEIAALDSDWSAFPVAEQAAFAFARKFTYQPHELCDADIETLRKHYTDLQILEMVLSMAGYNQINRWKEGAGIPQSQNGGGFGRRTEPGQATTPAAAAAPRSDRSETYLTPTAERFQTRSPALLRWCSISRLENRRGRPSASDHLSNHAAEVEARLAAAAKRSPRLPLVAADKAREVLPDNWSPTSLPGWVQLLASFPSSAKGADFQYSLG